MRPIVSQPDPRDRTDLLVRRNSPVQCKQPAPGDAVKREDPLERADRPEGAGWRPPAGTGAGDDMGQIGILLLGYLTIAMMLILVVTAASAVHLERKRLLALADAAALNAADDTDEALYLQAGVVPGQGVPLTDDLVRESARAYAAEAGAGFTGLEVVAPTGAPGGRAAEVSLSAQAQLPFVGWVLDGWGSSITLQVTSRAEARVG